MERLSKFPDENPNPVLMVAEDGEVYYANPASRPLLAHWGCQTGTCHLDDWRDIIADALASNVRRDVEIVCGDQIFSFAFVPGEDGNYVNVYGLDVTARKKAEEAMRKSERHFRQLFEINPFPLLISRHRDGEIVIANQAMADYLNLPLDELIGAPVLDFYANPAERQTIMQALDKYGKVTNWVFKGNTRTKEKRMMLLNMIVIEQDGEQLHLVGAADITAQIEAEEVARAAKIAAEEASHAKSAFLANISHELRTPLSAVLGFTELITSDSNLTQEQQDNLDIVMRSGEYLLTLINQVLDLSKVEAGQLETQAEIFDLSHLLQGMGKMFQLRAKRPDLWFRVELGASTPRVIRADASKLREVLINLLDNAIKFTERGGVTLRVREHQRGKVNPGNEAITEGTFSQASSHSDDPISTTTYLHFEVEDTGAGIRADEFDQLFESFVQTESGRALQKGTGLGLPISREYVRMMGGDISVKSNVSEGSTFQFDIPVEVIEAATAKPNHRQRRVVGLAAGQPAYKILVAEDRIEGQKLMRDILTPVGFEVQIAGNGVEAVENWQRWHPHLIFMDLRMPVLDGPTAIRQIRATSQGREEEHGNENEDETVIVAVTATAFEMDRLTLLSDGCDDFLRKPYRKDEIFELLARHLGVIYTYELLPDRMIKAVPVERGPDNATLAQALLGLSTAWRTDLKQAAIEGDLTWMSNLVTSIQEIEPVLAQTLFQWIDNFQQDAILALLK